MKNIDWKRVPVEPTEEMLEAAIDTSSMMIRDKYQAMLAAAPTPPEPNTSMEPVAWEVRADCISQLFYDKREALDASDGFILPLYSAEQLATLQAKLEL